MSSAQHTGTESWRNNLLTAANGTPKPLLANAITALSDSLTWQGVLAYDAFGLETIADRAPPWSMELEWTPRTWQPHDDLLVTNWLQHQGISVDVKTAAQAVETVARHRSFHPVIDYLESLEHDGTARAQNWLTTFMGAEPTPYNQAIGKAMLIAAVARIRNPGCKVDTVPIFEGVQGARKSTAIKALFDPWFTDELADLGSKDASMQTRGIWGIELSELDSMSRLEVSKIKAFISRTTDRFRPPYGSRLIESPRACVFWGTTNADNYLKDETGGRRFWPIKTGKIDVEGLREFRDQLWAEAVILFDAGVPWWIVKSEIQKDSEDQQRSRYVGDPWDKVVADYVETLLPENGFLVTTVHAVLTRGLDLQIKHCAQPEQNRVARILTSLGLVRRQRGSGALKHWVYSKVVPNDDTRQKTDNVTVLRVVPETEAPLSAEQVVPEETTAAQAQAPWHH